MEKQFNFVYVTTNIVNGKQYVGDHSTNDLNDEYLGSGNLIRHAIKKYKRENFKRKILKLFETKQEAFNDQELYIKKFKTLVPNGYNLSPSGGHGTNGGYLSEETKRKIGVSLSKSIKGRKLSEIHKQRLSEAHKGIKHTEETKKKLSELKKGQIPWIKGRHHTKETKRKISESGKGRKHSEETKLKFKNRIPWNKGLKNPF